MEANLIRNDKAQEMFQEGNMSYREFMKYCIKNKVPVYAVHPDSRELEPFIVQHYDHKTGKIEGYFVNDGTEEPTEQ